MPELITANEIDPTRLDAFLQRIYPPAKSAFLRDHGNWWHCSNQNRIVLLVEGEIAGYCAVIPAHIWAAGQVRPALWWVDLVIAPEFRGRGLQTLFDERVKGMADLLLGFPNELAAKIHRKHGWGVRQDLCTLLLPLRPLQVKSVVQAHGDVRALALKLGALVLTPFALIWRIWLGLQKPAQAWKLPGLDTGLLAEIFQRNLLNHPNTTWRGPEYFSWRYGQAPHPEEYTFYLAGPRQNPTHALIVRHVTSVAGLSYVRILDIFGPPASPALRDLLLLAVQDAIGAGAGQVTLLASSPSLAQAARTLGFVFSSPTGFCWLSDDPTLMNTFAGDTLWGLADSDNDSLD